MNQNNKATKILLSGGGTAGHITPLLAVVKAYQKIDSTAEFYYIGQKGDQNISVIESSELPIAVHRIHAGKYRRYHGESLLTRIVDVKTNYLNIKDAFKFMIGIIQARKIVKKIRPDVAFLKGGFVVVPVGKACVSHRVPYITHDSDPLPGLANRLIAKHAFAHAVAANGVKVYPKNKVRVTGIPLQDIYINMRHADRTEAKKRLGIDTHSLVLFVFAGTQGARTIDEAMNAIAPDILKRIPALKIIHVFGRLNQDMRDACYGSLNADEQSRITKIDFIHNAYDYIAAADLVLGRAGATTLAEIAMIGRAALIIPARHLTGGHQLENAELYAKNGGVSIINEESVHSRLADMVVSLMNNPEERKNMEDTISSLAHPDAADKIAQLMFEACKSRDRL